MSNLFDLIYGRLPELPKLTNTGPPAPVPLPPPQLPLLNPKQHFYEMQNSMMNQLFGDERLLGRHDPETQQSFVGFSGDKSTIAHEAAHSIWPEVSKDQATRWEWERIHAEETPRASQKGRYVSPFFQYPSDPSHSFAEAYNNYINDPVSLKNMHPQAYAYFQSLIANKGRVPRPR